MMASILFLWAAKAEGSRVASQPVTAIFHSSLSVAMCSIPILPDITRGARISAESRSPAGAHGRGCRQHGSNHKHDYAAARHAWRREEESTTTLSRPQRAPQRLMASRGAIQGNASWRHGKPWSVPNCVGPRAAATVVKKGQRTALGRQRGARCGAQRRGNAKRSEVEGRGERVGGWAGAPMLAGEALAMLSVSKKRRVLSVIGILSPVGRINALHTTQQIDHQWI